MSMRASSTLVALIFLTSCAATPDLERVASQFQSEMCDKYMGKGWVAIQAPADVEFMIDSLRFEVGARGLVWYKSEVGKFGACAYSSDRNGCGYSGYEFRKDQRRWFHARIWMQDRICVVG